MTGLLNQTGYFLGPGPAQARDIEILVQVKIGLFIDEPLFGQASPETQIPIPVDQPLEDQGLDVRAGGIRRQDRVEEMGIAYGSRNVLV